MSEFTNKMKLKYPHLFVADKSSPIMLFGIEVNKGWYELIDNLFENLSEGIILLQVKEKFGGLRVYYAGGTKEDNKLIMEAESKSVKICETCGKTGELHNNGGWYSVLCDEHKKHPS